MDFFPVFNFKNCQHLADVVGEIQSAVVSENIAYPGHFQNKLLFKSLKAEVWYLDFLCYHLVDVMEVEVGFPHFSQRFECCVVDG